MTTPKHLIEKALEVLYNEVLDSNKYLPESTADKLVRFLSIPAVHDHYMESKYVE